MHSKDAALTLPEQHSMMLMVELMNLKIQGPALLEFVKDGGSGVLGIEKKPGCCQQAFVCKYFW